MRYTVRCNGRALGSTTLDFDHLVHGQHSGWLHPVPGAQDLLDATSIGFAGLRAWHMRGDTLDNGRPLTQPEFLTSPEGEAISVAVSARSHLVLTLHREDGSELPTREILLQDRIYWDTLDDQDQYEGPDEQEDAEFEEPVEYEVAATREWNEDELEEPTTPILDDDAFRRLVEAQWLAAAESRYQVHVRLANPDDLPSELTWLTESSE